jgi:hypothetical protein
MPTKSGQGSPAPKDSSKSVAVWNHGALTIAAAQADADPNAPATFSDCVAYGGGEFNQWWGRVVLSLSGLILPNGPLPLLKDHGYTSEADSARLGVVTSAKVEPSGLMIAGSFLKGNELAGRIVADARAGFPFALSHCADILEQQVVSAGQKVTVNGRSFEGPIVVATKSRLREVSVVEVGADPEATFKIAASHGAHEMPTKTEAMGPDDMVKFSDITADWIKANKPELLAPQEDKPMPETAATIDQLSAIHGNNDALIVASIRAKHTPAQATEVAIKASRESETALRAKVAELEAKVTAASAAASAKPITGAGSGTTNTTTFANASGDDAASDWDASEDLRKHWNDNRKAFMTFAAMEKKDGRSYLVKATRL